MTATIRQASPEDAVTIVEMIRAMVTDMASYGGYPAAEDKAAWKQLNSGVAEELAAPDVIYLFAVASNGDIAGVGGARCATLGGAFAPLQILHINVLYVRPGFRRLGIANSLVSRLLEWGKARGATESTLNVLNGNPARELYERHGFSSFELKMSRKLC